MMASMVALNSTAGAAVAGTGFTEGSSSDTPEQETMRVSASTAKNATAGNRRRAADALSLAAQVGLPRDNLPNNVKTLGKVLASAQSSGNRRYVLAGGANIADWRNSIARRMRGTGGGTAGLVNWQKIPRNYLVYFSRPIYRR
jgi:uncharacterized protein HemX